MRSCLFIFLLLLNQASTAQKINKLIREADVRRILSTLASDEMAGRKPNTPGIEKAADFIAAEFASAGLRPLEGSSFRQSFNLYQYTVLRSDVKINGVALAAEQLWCFPGAEKISWSKGDAELVRIQAGENVLQRVYELVQSGKSCLVLADSSHRNMLARFRSFNPQKNEGSGTVVVAIFPGEPQAYSVQLEASRKTLNYANVAGVVPGKRANEYVVFSAHYDHLGIGKAKNQDSIYNGANDDASGTTAVISLARYFRKMKKPERTVVFVAFTAEESGGYGSRHFSKKMDPNQVVAMFNIEMIGTDSKWGKNSAFITGFEKSDFGTILQQSLQGSAFQFNPDPYPDQNLFYRSDNATLAELGVPAHTISTSKMDSEPFYHTVDDELETLDTKNMTEIIKAIALSGKTIIKGEKTPTRIAPVSK